jgi:hypothetical protein
MKNKKVSSVNSTALQQSRRDFVRKAAYISPVILTLPAMPSFAQQGSGAGQNTGGGDNDPTGDGCSATQPPAASDGQVQMCRFNSDMSGGQNIFIDESQVAAEVANGSVFGSCNDFFCSAS